MFTYLICDYSATGEGRTVCVMIAHSYVFDTLSIGPPEKTQQDCMKEAFARRFGEYLTIGMREVTKNEFEERYGWTIPETVYRMITEKPYPPGFQWSTEIYYNLS